MITITAVIPTLNAALRLLPLLKSLLEQSHPINSIIVIDSESDDNTCEIAAAYPKIKIHRILRKDFDHGETRDWAVRHTTDDYVWFLTQDALPIDNRCLEHLLKPFSDERVACAYARQTARADSRYEERLIRAHNYSSQSGIRTAEDIASMGIRAFYLSNVCCVYRRELYLAVGGFQHQLPTNEDMLLASVFLKAGYKIAYCAEACVYHSHKATLKEQYKRYFDIGAFLALYGKQLALPSLQGDGRSFAITIFKQLIRSGHPVALLRFGCGCWARFWGSRNGMRFARYAPSIVMKKCSNTAFWTRYLSREQIHCE